jgi:hypothetical protein
VTTVLGEYYALGHSFAVYPPGHVYSRLVEARAEQHEQSRGGFRILDAETQLISDSILEQSAENGTLP